MAFFRVVLTEHTKASKHWYTEVLWFYNPISKEFKLKNLEKIAKYISNGVQLSPRIEKLVKMNNVEIPTV